VALLDRSAKDRKVWNHLCLRVHSQTWEFSLKYGQQYVDKGAEYYERRNRQQQIEFVRKKAAQLGLQITPAHV